MADAFSELHAHGASRAVTLTLKGLPYSQPYPKMNFCPRASSIGGIAMLNFKLGPEREVAPEQDDMGRGWWGFSPTRSAQETYEQNRGVWLLGPRAARERHATFSFDGTVRVVVEVDRIETVPVKVGAGRPKSAIVGRVLQAGDPVHDALIGRPVDVHRNPVTYLDDPSDGPRSCACGCGTAVAGHRAFAPGHDQRAVHERISRQWGSTLGFIDWFDANYPAQPTTER